MGHEMPEAAASRAASLPPNSAHNERPHPMTLTLNDARALADHVFASAQERGLGVSCSVVDASGHELLTARMDDARWFTPGIARSKAQSAHVTRQPSADLAPLAERLPEVMTQINAQVGFPFTTLGGGLPIGPASALLGAIGVSGATTEEDIELAAAAIAALALG